MSVRHAVARRLAAVLGVGAAACAGDDRPAAESRAVTVDGHDTGRVALVGDGKEFVPGFAPGDAASAVVERFLRLSVADADSAPGARAALLGCGLGDASDLPAELLADFAITGRLSRGDTTVVRARVVTVAEQDRSRADPSRFTASQRVRRGEWEWDVVRGDDGAWRVCTGPRFGLVAPDSLTTWRPDGATSATARELAVTLRGRLVPAASSSAP
jgi:hypothetical protein